MWNLKSRNKTENQTHRYREHNWWTSEAGTGVGKVSKTGQMVQTPSYKTSNLGMKYAAQ